MASLDTFGGRSRVFLGFLFLVSCVPPMRTEDYFSLDIGTTLTVNDRLLSSPKQYFEFGIFPLNFSGVPNSSFYLTIRYAPPIDPAVPVWMSNSSIPLSSAAFLLFHANGSLELTDPNQNTHRNVWNTFTYNRDAVSVQLLDTGNLVLMKADKTWVWNSFQDSPPTDTLLPGMAMNRSQNHKLVSMQRSNDPNDKYSFGFDAEGVLSLSWTCPKAFLNWRGGNFIPAPDAYAARTIKGVDSVYFHKDLGHLYIGSNPPTAILSGGPNRVNDTTLKRITLDPDGGLRVYQYTFNETANLNQTSNQGWKVVANWVVSDRPDSRSHCTTFGACWQFSECVSPFDSLEPVTCRCPGKDDPEAKDWFKPIDVNDAAKGCYPPSQPADCVNGTVYAGTSPVGMLELQGVDMPWGGDYRNLTGNDSVNCKEACMQDCRCAGAVMSKVEQMCWMKNGVLLNIGWPTVALHGNDRTSFLRNQTVKEIPLPPAPKKDDHKLAKILAGTLASAGVLLLIAVMIICLWHYEMLPNCGSCCRRPIIVFQFPEVSEHERQVVNEQENGRRERTHGLTDNTG